MNTRRVISIAPPAHIASRPMAVRRDAAPVGASPSPLKTIIRGTLHPLDADHGGQRALGPVGSIVGPLKQPTPSRRGADPIDDPLNDNRPLLPPRLEPYRRAGVDTPSAQRHPYLRSRPQNESER